LLFTSSGCPSALLLKNEHLTNQHSTVSSVHKIRVLINVLSTPFGELHNTNDLLKLLLHQIKN